MYKIFPISGLYLYYNFKVPINYFCLGDNAQYEYVLFVNKEYMNDISNGQQCKYGIIEKCDATEAVLKFSNSKSFAIIYEYESNRFDFFFLRIALSILRCAFVRYYSEIVPHIWEVTVWDNYKYNENADIRIGAMPYGGTDFDNHIPCIYSNSSETPSYKRVQPFYSCDMEISYNIQPYIDNIAELFKEPISTNVKSAMNFFYYTLPQNNLDLSIVYLSSVLEALLTEENEEFIRKKISVRSACLVADINNLDTINFFANWIFYFYSLRCDIVHNAKSILVNNEVEMVTCNRAMKIVKYCIPVILSRMVELDIKTFNDLKTHVEQAMNIHGFTTSFDFITEELLFNLD